MNVCGLHTSERVSHTSQRGHDAPDNVACKAQSCRKCASPCGSLLAGSGQVCQAQHRQTPPGERHWCAAVLACAACPFECCASTKAASCVTICRRGLARYSNCRNFSPGPAPRRLLLRRWGSVCVHIQAQTTRNECLNPLRGGFRRTGCRRAAEPSLCGMDAGSGRVAGSGQALGSNSQRRLSGALGGPGNCCPD